MIELGLKVTLAYLVGSVLGSLLVGFFYGGVDIRKAGSGNAGGTNALRTQGKVFALWVMVIDIGKGILAVAVIPPLVIPGVGIDASVDRSLVLYGVAFAAIVGHVFPVWFGFRGGKGVACALGVFSALLPLAGLLAAVIYVQTLALTRVSAIGSLTAVNAAALHILITDTAPAYKGLVVAIAALIWVRHRGNLRELSRSRRASS